MWLNHEKPELLKIKNEALNATAGHTKVILRKTQNLWKSMIQLAGKRHSIPYQLVTVIHRDAEY